MYEGSITNLASSRFTSLMDSVQLPSPLPVVGLCLWVVSHSVGAIVDMSFFSLPLSIRNIIDPPHILTYHSYHCQMSQSSINLLFTAYPPMVNISGSLSLMRL